MRKADLRPLLAIAGVLAVAALVAIAGSDRGTYVAGVPVFAVCAAITFALQWLAFIPAYLARTERYFDLTGSVTYIAVVLVGLGLVGNWEPRSLIIAALMISWAARLGSFLFARVLRSGGDRRFDSLKKDPLAFLMTWTVQGLWVLLTGAAGLAAITTEHPAPLDWLALLGVVVWGAGFAIEVIADAQKQAFRKDPANHERFIRSGLWAWSRHPNYFGEIVIWTGVALIAAPALSGWQWAMIASPAFVFVVLTRVSGIPLLERQADRRWADDPVYRAYRAETPVLLPRPPRARQA